MIASSSAVRKSHKFTICKGIHNVKCNTNSCGLVAGENVKKFWSYFTPKNYSTTLGKTNAYIRSTCYHAYLLKICECINYIIKIKFYKLCLPPAFTLVSCSVYSLTLKMEAICSSEMLVNFQWTTWHYIPEDSAHQIL
jgi:hypothetical protein